MFMITIKEIRPEDTWPIRQMVMWPEKPIDFIKIEGDENALHYGLYVEGQLSSVISCFVKNEEIQFRKFATSAHRQKQGLGTCLLNHIIDESRRKGIKRISCNARLDKKHFYKRFGMIETDRRFLKDGIHFVIMELLLG